MVVRIAGITTISIGWIIGAAFVALGAAFVATTRIPDNDEIRPKKLPAV